MGEQEPRANQLPALTPEVIAERAGFSLVMTFTGFSKDNGYVSPDLHDERERLAAEYGEDNILPSFYMNPEGTVELGLFIRTEYLPKT